MRRLLNAFYWGERTAAEIERAIMVRLGMVTAAYILLAALLMSLAASHLHDRDRLQGEIELAREAYSQLVNEQIALRERLDELEHRG